MTSVARAYPAASMVGRALLLAGIGLFLAGIFSPIFTLEKFFLVRNTVSIVGACAQLFREGHYALFVIVAGFSVVLPILKFVLLWMFWFSTEQHRQRVNGFVHWVALYGKWSMLDVFVVAILLVTVKLGAIASVHVHPGLYAFAASVIVTMVATAHAMGIARRFDRETGPHGE
jgi:paraquat-inducible protein A